MHISGVSKHYGPQLVLDNVSFVVNPGERVGLVGPNGAGKSTLMRIIAGLEEPDSGSVGTGEVIGYLPQGIEPDPARTVQAEVLSGIPGYEEARQAVDELAVRLVEEDVLEAYGEALTRFERLGGYGIEHRVDELLDALGLDEVGPGALIAELSGGQRARVMMARVLLAEPGVLLLDEPTNHLDIEALTWLEGYLTRYEGAILLVSHDRAFLDRVATHIVALDGETHTARHYTGTYSDYLTAREHERQQQMQRWQEQVEEERRIKEAIRRIEQQANHFEGISKHDFQRRKAKVLMQKATAQKTRLERDLEAGDRVEKPRQRWHLKVDFGEMPHSGQIVAELDDVGFAYGGRWVVRHAGLTVHQGERITLIGPNGSGKTTLLRLLAGRTPPSEGSLRLGAGVQVGYMPQQQETLPPQATPLSLIREVAPISETEARTYLHQFLFSGDAVFIPAADLSYGERARLILARMVRSGVNLLVLDEPFNHLDLTSRERFEGALEAFPGTIIAAVHDRAFVDEFATVVWTVHKGELLRFPDRQTMEEEVNQ